MDVVIPAQSPLHDEHDEPRTCQRCGRMYERTVEGVVDGVRVRLEGHVPGDRVCRTADPLTASGVLLDARQRRAARARL